MIFFIIAFLASAMGAVSGIGGGIIIKPVLDALTEFSSSFISLISTICVFTMAVVSALKHFYSRIKVESEAVFLGIGAVLGGLAGTELFQFVLVWLGRDILMKFVQNIFLFLLLLFILCYMNVKNRKEIVIRNRWVIVLIGILLGVISAFLGIGGGPINVAALCFFFSMDIKKATANSMVLILFSQASKIATIFLSDTIPVDLNPVILFYMIPAAVLGGFVGTSINRSCNKHILRYSYNGVMVFVICTCFFNVLRLFY